jgi:hypothetical protein
MFYVLIPRNPHNTNFPIWHCLISICVWHSMFLCCYVSFFSFCCFIFFTMFMELMIMNGNTTWIDMLLINVLRALANRHDFSLFFHVLLNVIIIFHYILFSPPPNRFHLGLCWWGLQALGQAQEHNMVLICLLDNQWRLQNFRMTKCIFKNSNSIETFNS